MTIDWTQAPPWARYAAMDESGDWFWYAEKPTLRPTYWRPPAMGGFESFNPCPIHWTQTLTERPTE